MEKNAPGLLPAPRGPCPAGAPSGPARPHRPHRQAPSWFSDPGFGQVPPGAQACPSPAATPPLLGRMRGAPPGTGPLGQALLSAGGVCVCEGPRALEASLLPHVPHTVLRGEVSPAFASLYPVALPPGPASSLLPGTKVTPSPGKSGSPSEFFLPGAVSRTLFTQSPRGWWGGREPLDGARAPELGQPAFLGAQNSLSRKPQSCTPSPPLCFWGWGEREQGERTEVGAPRWRCRERLEDETEDRGRRRARGRERRQVRAPRRRQVRPRQTLILSLAR